MSVDGLRELLSPRSQGSGHAVSPVRLLRPLDESALGSGAVHHFVFAYGSLIKAGSRTTSLPEAEAALEAELGSELGLRRSWCFRSPTGFTALGVTPCAQHPGRDDGRGAIPAKVAPHPGPPPPPAP